MGKHWTVVPLALFACGEVNSSPDGAEIVDARRAPDSAPDADTSTEPDAAPVGEWSAPMPLVAVSDAAAREQSPTITGDGLELWFLRASDSGVTLWRSQRATVDAPWGPPVEFPRGPFTAPMEISPDGLEMFQRAAGGRVLVTRRITRDALWATGLGAGREAFVGAQGGAPTLGADGLTVFYHADGATAFVAKRQRFNLAASWGEPVPAEIEYPRPPSADHFALISLRDDTVLLSGPPLASQLPSLAQLTRNASGFWGDFEAVPMPGISDCELATRSEAVCVAGDDLVRIERAQP